MSDHLSGLIIGTVWGFILGVLLTMFSLGVRI
jgi:hypothetical protein